jgi:DUF2945 family protein
MHPKPVTSVKSPFLAHHSSENSKRCGNSHCQALNRVVMTKAFKVGDRVSWNSEAGRVSGTIIRVHMRDVEHKGYTHHANPDVPQYEVKSAKTDHIAFHKGSALTKLRD